jgi:hypothetical protein
MEFKAVEFLSRGWEKLWLRETMQKVANFFGLPDQLKINHYPIKGHGLLLQWKNTGQ